MGRRPFLQSVLVLLVLGGVLGPLQGVGAVVRPLGLAPPVGAARPEPAVGLLATYHGNLARTGYEPDERTIRTSDIDRLGATWSYEAGGPISNEATVADGIAYWGDWAGEEHATTEAGRQLWSTDLGVTTAPPSCPRSSTGIASTPTVGTVGDRERIWTGGGDGTVVELAADSGRVIWRTRVAPQHGGFVWSSPALYGGDIYIGVSSYGDCPLVRGRLVRLDAVTGQVLGTFFVTPRGCLGGGIWSSPTVDPETGSIFVTTGNAACTTPFQNAMLQIDPTSMRLLSSWQIPPAAWTSDSDWGATPTLFSAQIGSRIVGLVGSADKDGIFYAVRSSDLGRGPVWETRVAQAGDCPNCGAGSIAPAAFDGTTLFVAGGRTTVAGQPCKGSVQALDPADGAPIWQDCLESGSVLGPLTETPGLIFLTAGPDLLVVRSRTGAQLFTAGDADGDDYYAGPSVADGVVYCGNSDGTMFAFGLTGSGRSAGLQRRPNSAFGRS